LDSFTGVGGSERVEIGDWWFKVRTEVNGTSSVKDLPFVIGRWVVEVFKGPITGIDAALQQGLDAAEVKGWAHQRTLQIGWRRAWLRTLVLLARRPVSMRIPALSS
jgi:hypothetical protein